MFTWICPKCGAEVPPSESECPRCVDQAPTAAAPAASAPPSAAPSPPPQRVQAPRQGLPAWVVVLVVAGLLIGAGWVGIRWLSLRSESAAAAPRQAPVAAPQAPAPATHPLAKHLEVTGVRVIENTSRKLEVRLVVVNHSAAELPNLRLRVELRPKDAPQTSPAVSTLIVDVPSLGPNEVRDVKALGTTTLRAYEFPDWQFLKADFAVLAP